MRPRHWILVIAVLLIGLFVRTYKVESYLGFWYDQGRDALVIWDLIYNHKFFLIGPTTGIEGIFRGPWYYWLITPFYFLGRGNPVWPAVFLAFTTIVASALSFVLAKKIAGFKAGFLALVISSLSYNLVGSARWLSNPTPMFTISAGILYFFFKVIDGKKTAYLPLSFLLGLSMQFGSAAEIFYFPAIALFVLIHKKLWPDLKTIILSSILIIIPFAPQIIFDLRHDGILSKNISKFFVDDQSFQLSFVDTLRVRLPFYYDMFSKKLFPMAQILFFPFGLLSLLSIITRFKKMSLHESFLSLLFFMPLVGMLFFHGNKGNVYDYYFTGYYLVFVILFSVSLSQFFSKKLALAACLIFLGIFLKQNTIELVNYIRAGEGTYITLASGIKAVDWIYNDAAGIPFNTDAYVPPMIPYSYEYLFLWRGTMVHNTLPKKELLPLLYTIQEPDPGHQTLLDTWRTRQSTFSSIVSTYMAGPLVVERRHRHEK